MVGQNVVLTTQKKVRKVQLSGSITEVGRSARNVLVVLVVEVVEMMLLKNHDPIIKIDCFRNNQFALLPIN